LTDMPREDLARALAEHVYAMRPDREPAAPLTPEQIIHRITLMVDAGRLAEMHQQVEATAAALREKEAEAETLSAHAAEMEARVTALTEERRALAQMLSTDD
jgi:septal ring factor EnvC (AmiA/AmiB activator)